MHLKFALGIIQKSAILKQGKISENDCQLNFRHLYANSNERTRICVGLVITSLRIIEGYMTAIKKQAGVHNTSVHFGIISERSPSFQCLFHRNK